MRFVVTQIYIINGTNLRTLLGLSSISIWSSMSSSRARMMGTSIQTCRRRRHAVEALTNVAQTALLGSVTVVVVTDLTNLVLVMVLVLLSLLWPSTTTFSTNTRHKSKGTVRWNIMVQLQPNQRTICKLHFLQPASFIHCTLCVCITSGRYTIVSMAFYHPPPPPRLVEKAVLRNEGISNSLETNYVCYRVCVCVLNRIDGRSVLPTRKTLSL